MMSQLPTTIRKKTNTYTRQTLLDSALFRMTVKQRWAKNGAQRTNDRNSSCLLGHNKRIKLQTEQGVKRRFPTSIWRMDNLIATQHCLMMDKFSACRKTFLITRQTSQNQMQSMVYIVCCFFCKLMHCKTKPFHLFRCPNL